MASVLKQIADAEREGFTFFSAWRKAPTQPTTGNIWFDLSMSPGNPVPNYYIGTSGVFTPLAQSTDGGISHGGNVWPKKKHVSHFSAQTSAGIPVPINFLMLDYLGFYPFIDESVLDPQLLDNTRPLPRHKTGKGVQMMPVVVAGQSGGQLFTVNYTNDQGVSGRVTPPHVMGTQAVNGTILSSAGAAPNSRGPFMALQEGDTGVLRADSIQFLGTGDIGLIALVLVKQIMGHSIRGIDAPVEKTPIIDAGELPEIVDDAYLNLISLPFGSLQAAPLIGTIKTTWI
jgi:hypothetical protein